MSCLCTDNNIIGWPSDIARQPGREGMIFCAVSDYQTPAASLGTLSFPLPERLRGSRTYHDKGGAGARSAFQFAHGTSWTVGAAFAATIHLRIEMIHQCDRSSYCIASSPFFIPCSRSLANCFSRHGPRTAALQHLRKSLSTSPPAQEQQNRRQISNDSDNNNRLTKRKSSRSPAAKTSLRRVAVEAERSRGPFQRQQPKRRLFDREGETKVGDLPKVS